MSGTIQPFTEDSDPKIRGFLHTPEKSNNSGLVLSHGAGSNAAAPLLAALAEAFTSAGFTVLRIDLPFRQSRPYGPPGPADAARDRAGITNAAAALKKIITGPIFLAGHSYGGRQSSMLAAEQPDLAAGLILFSYPLHPPLKPEQLRTQHFTDLRTPSLFFHGTRDPFGSIAELQQSLKIIPAKTKLITVEGHGHDLGFKGKSRQEKFPAEAVQELNQFFAHE
jgi:predicted alpha/beta-hydrolase family hydrolase